MKRPRRQTIEIDVGELRAVLERARQEPISEADYRKMKVALDVLAERLMRTRTSEKTRAVVEQRPLSSTENSASSGERRAGKGHGRHGTGAYTGAQKVIVRHANLASGDRCPECARGRVYTQQKPKTLVRIVGRAPVEATVYEMERLRCNACGQVFTAEEPAGIGADKYDASAVTIIAQLKYGTGVPFARLERLERQVGRPPHSGS